MKIVTLSLLAASLVMLAVEPIRAAQIDVTVPDAIYSNVVEAIAETYHYADTKKPNETKPAFAQRIVSRFVREVYRSWKIRYRIEQVRLMESVQVDTDFPER